ncbi:hypothetical protein L1987_64928 [Smallanthus sonchifolius]|uniref:Uncharacterized protein n=1 Tax=Smallanthus sonchifolius TaxID=185202 RepID=A0ACB9BSY1_9ASTR|nr:hypothetical protein L1987_64928 [Smallanthus sonchifolius]
MTLCYGGYEEIDFRVIPHIIDRNSNEIRPFFISFSSPLLYHRYSALRSSRGEFKLNNFKDGILFSDFMVGLLLASPIFAATAKRLVEVARKALKLNGENDWASASGAHCAKYLGAIALKRASLDLTDSVMKALL